MDADGAIDLAAATEQIRQCQVGLDGLGIDLDQPNEDLDGLVLLLVEQVIEATEIVIRQSGGAALVTALTATGVLTPDTHHLLEHGLDVVLVALVVAAVYYARTVERRVEEEI
jgi:hypothetical protein